VERVERPLELAVLGREVPELRFQGFVLLLQLHGSTVFDGDTAIPENGGLAVVRELPRRTCGGQADHFASRA
jgi:hypothetical protein